VDWGAFATTFATTVSASAVVSALVSASGAVTLAVHMDCGASVICKDEQAQRPSSEPFCRTRNSQHCCEFCRRTQGGHSQYIKPAPTIIGAGLPS